MTHPNSNTPAPVSVQDTPAPALPVKVHNPKTGEDMEKYACPATAPIAAIESMEKGTAPAETLPVTMPEVIAALPASKGTNSGRGFTVTRTVKDPHKVRVALDGFTRPALPVIGITAEDRAIVSALCALDVQPDTNTERALWCAIVAACDAAALHAATKSLLSPAEVTVYTVCDDEKAEKREAKKLLDAQPAYGLNGCEVLATWQANHAEATKKQARAEFAADLKAKGFTGKKFALLMAAYDSEEA